MELKTVCINVVNHSIEPGELQEFVEYMSEENIEVLVGQQPADITETLIITDSEMKDCKVATVGYGADYKGKVAYVTESLDVWVSFLRMVYARHNGLPWEVARTERLVIREMTLEDLPAMYELYESISDCPYVEPLYEWDEEYDFTSKYIENMYTFFGYGLWLVFEKDTGELVGRVGIENRTIDGEMCQELGYLIKKDRQKRGYALESLRAIIDIAKSEMCLRQLFICTHKDNVLSITIAKKLGFEVYAEDIEGMNLYRRSLWS